MRGNTFQTSALRFFLIGLFAFFSNIPAFAAHYRAAMFLPQPSAFWVRFAAFSKAAADDIGLDLDINYADSSPERMLGQVETAANSGVNAILFMEFDGIGKRILDIAEAHKIPAFLVNTGLDDNKFFPRNQYQYWIGGVLPDDYAAGVRLATELINAAQKTGAGQLRILAFTGKAGGLSYAKRLEGLTSVVNARPQDVTLTQALALDERDSETAILTAVKAHRDINIIWSVNDGPALAAARIYQKLGLPGVISGGIDWSSEALTGVAKQELTLDLGGHVFDGAQAVIMMFDYLNGLDFADEGLLFPSNMIAANRQNISRYQRILENPGDIDYKELSKVHNQKLSLYHFDLNTIAESNHSQDLFTPTERDWMHEHPVIRFGAETDWAPFDFVDKTGKHIGYAHDLLTLISKYTGLSFAPEIDRWNVLLDKIKAKRIDLLPPDLLSEDGKVYLNYTEPYEQVINYFFLYEEVAAKTIADLNGKTVAIPKGYPQIDELKKNYPKLKLLETDGLMEAVQAVIERKADILLDSYAVLRYVLKKNNINSIRPFKPLPYNEMWNLRMSVRKDWPILVSILNKTLAAIPDQEKQQLRDKWVGSQ